MGQVYLSEKQRDALELAHDNFGTDGTIDKHCLFQKNGVVWEGRYEPLNDITMSDLAKAFYLGYKIKPKFKVGDWLFVNGEVVEIVDETETRFVLDGGWGEKAKRVVREYYRHATSDEIEQEKERRWWKKHGRDVWELKYGDVLSDKESLHYTSYAVSDIFEEYEEVKYGLAHKGCYTLDEIKSRFKVVCFTENRLDI